MGLSKRCLIGTLKGIRPGQVNKRSEVSLRELTIVCKNRNEN